MELMTLFMNHHTICLIFNATISYSAENIEQQGPIKLKSHNKNLATCKSSLFFGTSSQICLIWFVKFIFPLLR